MNNRKAALKMLQRKRGATIEQMMERLDISERSARNLIDNMRRSGHTIQNTGSCTFQATLQ